MGDIVPELLKEMQQDYEKQYKSNTKIRVLSEKLKSGAATYAEANEYAAEVGAISKNVLEKYLVSSRLPEGKCYYNIANRVLPETENRQYKNISGYTEKVQSDLNKKAGIGLKAQVPEEDTRRVEGLVNVAANAEIYDDVGDSIAQGIESMAREVVDNSVKKNVEFQGKAGLSPKIERAGSGRCCDWCADLIGTYDYPNVPKEVYARHNNCTCTVEYNPGSGKRQDVWSKSWISEEDAQKRDELRSLGLDNEDKHAKIEYRKSIGAEKEYTRRKIGTQGQEIIDKATYNKVTRSFIKNKGIIIRGEVAERHLDGLNAYASYSRGGNYAYIRDDATVSDVLEEMYHAMQDRTNMFGNYCEDEMVLRREIDAQKYLLSVIDKYKIPQSETDVTLANLKDYENQLVEYLSQRG